MNAPLFAKQKEEAQELLKKLTGSSHEVKGSTHHNQVFINLQETYMVKFMPFGEEKRLETEVTLYGVVKENPEVKAPEISLYGKGKTGLYLVRPMIEGIVLQEVLLPQREDLPFLLHQCGKMLGQIHETRGFAEKGFILADLSISPQSIFSSVEYAKFFPPLLRKGWITKAQYQKLSQLPVDTYFPPFDYRLCHCDYNPQNILIKKDITGILDLEWACSAPVMDDLITLPLFLELAGAKEHIASFYEGYAVIRPLPSLFIKNETFYKLYRLLTMLSYQAQHENFKQKEQKNERALLHEILKELL